MSVRLLLGGLVVAAGLLLAACRAGTPGSDAPLRPQPTAHATGFRLLDGDGYAVAEVTRPFPGAADTLRYLLVPRGAAVPDVHADATIRTPVETVAALSTTHLALLDALGAAETVVAVADARLVNTPAVQARLATGAAVPVGEGETLDVETLVALGPDVVLMSSLGGGGTTRAALEAAGVPVVLVGEWAEATPLGRAEWLRFFGALVGEEARADSAMAALAVRYEAVRAVAQAQRRNPSVFIGSAYGGVWYAPGGGSYMAALLRDAGGRYVWADTPGTGSLALDVETVFARAGDADVWLNPGVWTRLADGTAQDATYEAFEAFQRGRVYNYTARQSAGGGYDFFETGVVEPDVLLADLVRIFHPGALPDTALVYYERLR